MPPTEELEGSFAAPPEPADAGSVDDLVERLRRLKVWAGDPSYETIKDRVNAAWRAAGRPADELAIRSTVANCFTLGRRRLNTDLVLAIVEALHPDPGYVTHWRQALRVVSGEIEAVAQVRVLAALPRDLAGFTGRVSELDRLRLARKAGEAVLITAIEGMAGVGKTQLAVHAGHVLHEEDPFDRILFVNLRGFHPNPAQPPADPVAVLEGFLRLLGMPGQLIPHDLNGRRAAYRDRLAGCRALIVLDNAATSEQVRPLLPDAPGCLTLITSRRRLTDLQPGSRLPVDVFSPDEAAAFLRRALPFDDDPEAIARIAHRCAHLPLALSLIAGHIRNAPGWTLADHADRLDERHQQQRLDSGVELALSLSYQHLSSDGQRLFRLAALHPGQDLDAYAAAALAGTDLDTTHAAFDQLVRDHLVQPTAPGRFTFHDLVRAYAAGRAQDEDPPAERRAALTRLFDLSLATAAAAMDTLHPAEAHRRPRVAPAQTPGPDLADPDTAVAWLDLERPTLMAVIEHAAAHGWPAHATRLARVLSRHFDTGHHADAMIVHQHAVRAARDGGDLGVQAHALTDLGVAFMRLGEPDRAAEHFRQAVALFRQTDDPTGARALFNLGAVAERSGRYAEAVEHMEQALTLYRQAGDRTGEGRALNGIGYVMQRVGRRPEAGDYHRAALAVARQTGSRASEAEALLGLADAALGGDDLQPAEECLQRALVLYRQLGNRDGEAGTLDSLGLLHARQGRPELAIEYFDRALAMFRENGDQNFEVFVLNNRGAALLATGRFADAVASHSAAGAIAAALGPRDQQALADAGLGHAHRALGEHGRAREHYERALSYFAEADRPEADEIRAGLADLPTD